MARNVVLVGGAPGAGKTTLGRALASRLGWLSLSVDHLRTAASAVTTPETHPGLHVMSRARSSADYFTNASTSQLIDDATAQHEAIWPAVERIVRQHAGAGPGIVIDGWHMRPRWVAALELSGVLPAWIVTTKQLLERRELDNDGFFAKSPQPERMRSQFLSRSYWYNDLIRTDAKRLDMLTLDQDGDRSVDQLCNDVLAAM